MMSRQQRRQHDPIIDTEANSDDDKVEEIITAAGDQDQIELAPPSQDSSMLGVFNGEPLCSSNVSPFKKMYNTSGSLAEAVESLSTSPLDSDALTPFSIDLGSMHHNSPLPTRIKNVDHFSVSVPDCLPPHLMELDSPEPDLYEQEMQQSCEGLAMDTITKDVDMSPEQFPPSGTEHGGGEISLQQAKTYIPSPSVSNGEDFDLNEVAAVSKLDSEAVTYSQSDIFASQPLTFGLEPKTVDLSPDNLEPFDDDSRPELAEIRASSKETSPFSMLNEIECMSSSKRKRDDFFQDEKCVKKFNLEHPESSISFEDDSPLSGGVEDEVKILSDADQSVEVIYDNKLLQEKESLQSQDIQLYLSSNTQNVESHIADSNPCTVSDNGFPKKAVFEAPSNQSSSPSDAEQIYSCSNGTLDESQHPTEANSKLLTKAVVKLPSFDTPSQLTQESGETLFVNATKAAKANIPCHLDCSPNFSSPSDIIPVEKSISSASPNGLQERARQMQSTPLSGQTPSKSLFASQKQPVPNRSRVLAEDSDEDVKRPSASGALVSSGANNHSSSRDTEVEFIMERNDVRNQIDLRNANWCPVITQIRTAITRWTHPESKEVLYSIHGDEGVSDGNSVVEKIISAHSLSSGSSRTSNVSSFYGLNSDGYLADKSSSSYSASISLPETTRSVINRRSMASVESISPPRPLLKLPPPRSCSTTSTQTDDEDQSKAKVKIPKARGRPRMQKVQVPILEVNESDISTTETSSSTQVILETPKKDAAKKVPLEPKVPVASKVTSIVTKRNVTPIPVVALAQYDDFLSQIQPTILDKLKSIHVSLSDEEQNVFLLDERAKHLKISDDAQHTLVRQRVREADIRPDMLVFARYNSDKNYYSAVVKAKDKEDRWKISYNFDNQESSVREIYILPTDLLPKSYPVYVLHPSRDFHEPGIVRGHVFRDEVLLHIVEIHGTTASVPHSHLLLKELHANLFLKARAAYRSLVGSPGGDLALDNILLRRTRGSSNSPRKPPVSMRKPDPNFDTSGQEDAAGGRSSAAAVCRTGRKQRSDLVVTVEGTESSEFSGSPLRKKRDYLNSPRPQRSIDSPRSRKKKPTVDIPQPLNPVVRLNPLPETEIPVVGTPTRKRGRKATIAKTPKKTRKLNEDEPNGFFKTYGTIPPKNSTLFSGYSILITEMIYLDKLDKNFSPSPMERDHLTQQIESGGGTVLPSFDVANLIMVQEAKKAVKRKGEAPPGKNYLGSLSTLEARDSPAKVLCVSNAPCRTAKFIQCLTVGIPIVSTSWVIKSCVKNQCLNWISHLLPAGKSLLTKTMMAQPFHDFDAERHSNVAKVVDVLKGDKVFLATSSEDAFKNTWMELLSTAEAQVFTKTASGKLNRLMDRKTSVVLADATIPADELKRAEEIRAPVVSTEWFIQCIIQRCKVQYTAHPKFRYNYTPADGDAHCGDSDNEDDR